MGKRRFIYSLIVFLALQVPTFAAADILPSIVPEAGTLNTHDIETLRKQQIEQQVEEDFQNYKKHKEDGNIKPEKKKENKSQG